MAVNLLIIDDNESDRRLIQESLEDLDVECSVDMAVNGEEGVEKAIQAKPDIVIIDTVLPGMDGYETCSKIKANNEQSKIIMITGKMEAVDEGRAKEAGADEYELKTPDYMFLLDAIKKLI